MHRIGFTNDSMTSTSLLNWASAGSLKDCVMVVSGGSRGIGLAIARRAAKDGCRVAILAKTTEAHPKLPGTIFTAAKEIEAAGGEALPLKCDVRFEEEVKKCIAQVVEKWGRIDIVLNNASAINLECTETQDMKKYDLMAQVNVRATFLLTKTCLPWLKKSPRAHILTLSPPLSMDPKWFQDHLAYTMAKYGMSMCVLGWSAELRDVPVSSNALWPRTAIATAAVQNHLGGDLSVARSRNDEIMADSAYVILTTKPGRVNGQFLIDDEVLRSVGVKDFKKYQLDQNLNEDELMPDLFV